MQSSNIIFFSVLIAFTILHTLGIWRTLNEIMEKYGPFSKIWIGFELSVVLQDLNDVEVCIVNKTKHNNPI